jgi:uncharacterized membrane protein YedE/YeeE
MEQSIGLITGILFGFFLQKGEALRFERQVGFLSLIDMTIFKLLMTAIIVGMVGLYLFRDLGIIALSPKATHLGAQIIGGLLFGIGWAIVGYCPGTSIGAVGEGRWHAIWAIVGMLIGAAIFAEVYPSLKSSIIAWGSYGKVTIPEALGVNHWIVIAIFVVLVIGMFKWFENKNI